MHLHKEHAIVPQPVAQGPTAQLDQANDFRKLRICIQRNTKKGQSLPYGVITIPKFSITSPWEGWASIQAPVSQKGSSLSPFKWAQFDF